MTADTRRVRPGARVRLHLSIRLQDGTEAISTLGEEPLELTLGDGTLVCGLEALLLGMAAGEERHLVANGGDLFGGHVAEKIHWLPRGDFPAGIPPEPGQVIAFSTAGGAEAAGLVIALDGERVQVDFNHPLAGRLLQIEAQVLTVGAPADGAESP